MAKRKLSGSFSELDADWREAQDNVQVALEPFLEELVQLRWGWVVVGQFVLLVVVVSAIRQPGVFLVFRDESGDFARGEDHVDVLQELLLLDFGVRQQKGELLVEMPTHVVEVLDVLLQVLFLVVLGDGQLLDLLPSDVCGQSGQALLPGPSDSHQQGGGLGHLDGSRDSEQVTDGVVKQH